MSTVVSILVKSPAATSIVADDAGIVGAANVLARLGNEVGTSGILAEVSKSAKLALTPAFADFTAGIATDGVLAALTKNAELALAPAFATLTEAIGTSGILADLSKNTALTAALVGPDPSALLSRLFANLTNVPLNLGTLADLPNLPLTSETSQQGGRTVSRTRPSPTEKRSRLEIAQDAAIVLSVVIGLWILLGEVSGIDSDLGRLMNYFTIALFLLNYSKRQK